MSCFSTFFHSQRLIGTLHPIIVHPPTTLVLCIRNRGFTIMIFDPLAEAFVMQVSDHLGSGRLEIGLLPEWQLGVLRDFVLICTVG